MKRSTPFLIKKKVRGTYVADTWHIRGRYVAHTWHIRGTYVSERLSRDSDANKLMYHHLHKKYRLK